MKNSPDTLTSKCQTLVREVIAHLAEMSDRAYPPDLEKQVVHYHCARALDLVRATDVLVKSGFARSGLVLNRSLLNLVINLAWLTSGYHPARMEWFADCEVLTVIRQIEKLRLIDHISQEQYEADISLHSAEWNSFLRKYGYDWSQRKPPREWATSIKQLAYDLREDSSWFMLWKDYELSYGYLSAEEHTDPRSVLHHLEKNGLHSRAKKSTENDGTTLLIETCRYGIYVLIICGHFLGNQIDIDSLSRELGVLQDHHDADRRSSTKDCITPTSS